MIARLSDLLAVLDPLGARRADRPGERPSQADPPIRGIALHSKRVAPGEVFVAIPGTKHDGTEFAAEAAQRGAVAVVVPRALAGLPVPQIVVSDVRVAAAEAAAAWFGHPSRQLLCVGVTGTNGKTTTSYLIRAVLEASGKRCGLLGTIGYDLLGRTLSAPNTTPDAVSLQGLLRELVDAGAAACVMEVSSHALDQARVHGIDYDAAVFTNLTPEHMDYHRDLAAYREAKARLFDGLGPKALAVISAEDASGPRMAARTRATVLRFGIDGDGVDVRGSLLEPGFDGTRFRMAARARETVVDLALPGRHNVANALAASAAALGLGVPFEEIPPALASVKCVPGRLERVDAGSPFPVFVDYAHTDASLEAVLGHLRPLTPGNLSVVFGCGGDRDRTKRPRMGAVAARHADRIFLTSDNPRTEDPDAILEEILSGIGRREAVRVEPDRREAIFAAVRSARPGEVILIAGKGHEKVQVVGDEARPFDDRAVAQEALREAV